MKSGNRHRHNRSLKGFETHRRERGSSDVRQGKPWRFAGGGRFVDPFEPHYRVTARMAALPGKHFRSVREPVRASHGRVD